VPKQLILRQNNWICVKTSDLTKKCFSVADDAKNRLFWDYTNDEWRYDMIKPYAEVMGFKFTKSKVKTTVNTISKAIANASQEALDGWEVDMQKAKKRKVDKAKQDASAADGSGAGSSGDASENA